MSSLSEEELERGLIACSSGNFALALLHGLFSGRHRPATQPDEEAWFRLGYLLKYEMFEGSEGEGWQSGFIALRRQSPDDETALKDLASLYRKLGSHSSGWPA